MRRFVAVLVVALLALSVVGLVGCGGGAEEPPAETAAPAPAPAPAPTPAADEAVIADRSAEETAVFEPFPKGDGFPESLVKAVDSKQPTLILFVDGAQKDTNDIKSEVNTVATDNQGLIDLFTYDLGKYASIKPDGTIVVDDAALQDDATASGAVELANALGVNFTPFVVITDDQGFVIYKHSGFIDSELLDRQVQRVTD